MCVRKSTAFEFVRMSGANEMPVKCCDNNRINLDKHVCIASTADTLSLVAASLVLLVVSAAAYEHNRFAIYQHNEFIASMFRP